MLYNIYSPTLVTANPSSDLQEQSPQVSWNFAHEIDRTAVTYPSTSSETAFEGAFQISPKAHYYKVLKKYLQVQCEALQVLLASTHSLSCWEQKLPDSTFLEGMLNFIIEWSETSALTTFLSEPQLQQIGKYYAFRGEAEIERVLREYPFLIQILLDTYSNIEAFFPDSRVFLEVIMNYEVFDQYPAAENKEELVISIATSLSAQEAMKALRAFYDSWWLKASKAAKRKISVGLELI